MNDKERDWRVVQTVDLAASADRVWSIVGGFFNIHVWHPDISITEIPVAQVQESWVRRVLTFPGQPKTTEELVVMNNHERFYDYKWHAGAWGEKVRNYRARIHVFEKSGDESCCLQWSSCFTFHEDAVSEFYWNGFRNLQGILGC